MARARLIKPGFFKNEDLAKCDPLARLLFSGLWVWADKDGLLEDRPERLKIEILPYDNCDVDQLLNQLASRGFIERYEAKGIRCISVLKFSEHQNPHPNETPSGLPKKHTKKTRKEIKLHDKKCKNASSSSYSFNSSSNSSKTMAADKPPHVASQSAPETLGTPSATTDTASDTPASVRHKPRDELFDAVAVVTASDPKASGSHIGRVCKALRSADPPYTADEVRRWAEIVRAEGWMQGYPSLGYLEKNIGKVRAPPAPQPKSQPKPKGANRDTSFRIHDVGGSEAQTGPRPSANGAPPSR